LSPRSAPEIPTIGIAGFLQSCELEEDEPRIFADATDQDGLNP
jgi:hypothetical protein